MTGGFTFTITVITDDIPDLLAYGRRLRDTVDGSGATITTMEEAVREVAYIFGAGGVDELMKCGDVYAQLDSVGAVALEG